MSESVNGVFPAGRTKVTLGDIARNISENEYKPKEKGLDRCVGLEHLDPGSLKICRWSPITPEMSFTRRFYNGQILFGKRRAYQKKVALADFDGICSSDILVIEAKKEIFVPELLSFIIQDDRFFEYAVGTSSGSLSPRTKWKFLAEYEIWLPSLGEQRRSATTLWTAEDCIVKGEQFLAAAERVKKIFIQFLFNHKFDQIDRNWGKKSSESPEIELEKVSLKVTDIDHIMPQKIASGIPFVSVGDIVKYGSNLDLSEVEKISNEDYLYHSKKFNPEKNDLLLTRFGSIGHPWIISTDTPFIASYSIVLIKPNHDLIDYLYLFYCFKSNSVERQISQKVMGSANKNYHLEDIKKLRIPLPPLPEQRQIAGILTRCDETIAAARANIGAAKALKMKMINEMLSPKS